MKDKTSVLGVRIAEWLAAVLQGWVLLLLAGTVSLWADERPNIIVILADDMGYGDIQALNPDSNIPTPNLDRLAREGMRFTDAHSPSGVCTPTRYGLLTGRYCWRTELKRGVLGGYSLPLLPMDRATLATLLKSKGYRTGAVGKWHLGMQLPVLDPSANRSDWSGDPGIDFAGEIGDSPVHHGFDEYFGVSASLDMAPYVYIRNDRFTRLPTIQQPAVKFPHFVRAGPRAADFVIDEVLDRLTKEALHFIEESAPQNRPFFLYFPLTGPHKPTQPHARFRGKTALGEYGDFMVQVDWTVGEVLKQLESLNIADETMVVFTSDNGSYMYRLDSDTERDHVDDETIQAFRASRHRPNGPFRGTKADIWEAGHHVPFLVRWPGEVEAGAACKTTICLTDLYATFAELVEAAPRPGDAEDSFSLLTLFREGKGERGAPVIHHSSAGMFSIREGKWKLVLGNGSGGRQAPRGKPFGKPYQLYDLSQDTGESRDLAAEFPRVVADLTEKAEAIRADSGAYARW